MKTKSLNDVQFLALLQKVLPKATQNAQLAAAIYEEVLREVRLLKNLQSFEKFCEKGGLPNLEPDTMAEFQRELGTQFGEDKVEITPDETGSSVSVAIELPDRVFESKVKVDPALAEEEPVLSPFVPFPVVLPEDPELVWVLGRREDFSAEEAARALARIEEEFWETKKGLELQKSGTDKCFAEFIIHIPASSLAESHLKRHYKEPETLHTLRTLRGGAGGSQQAREASF